MQWKGLTLEEPHVISVSPVPAKYGWLWWRSPALAECVQAKYGASRLWKNPVVFANFHTKSHRKFGVHYQDHCWLHNIVCRLLFVRIRLQSREQFLQSKNIKSLTECKQITILDKPTCVPLSGPIAWNEEKILTYDCTIWWKIHANQAN